MLGMMPLAFATGRLSDLQEVSKSLGRRKKQTFSLCETGQAGEVSMRRGCAEGEGILDSLRGQVEHYKLSFKSQPEEQPIHSINKIHTTNKI